MTANELHIPVSDPARPRPTFLKLLSADTDHSFWVPELGRKDRPHSEPREPRCGSTRTAPGSSSASARSTAGRSTGRCSCAWWWTAPRTSTRGCARSSSRRSRDEQAAAGRRVFETTACINCHAVAGTAANGRFGPDLTHLMSRSTIASGAAENTRENLRLWIENPDAIKPGSLMPAMKLGDADLDALVAYMETLR